MRRTDYRRCKFLNLSQPFKPSNPQPLPANPLQTTHPLPTRNRRHPVAGHPEGPRRKQPRLSRPRWNQLWPLAGTLSRNAGPARSSPRRATLDRARPGPHRTDALLEGRLPAMWSFVFRHGHHQSRHLGLEGFVVLLAGTALGGGIYREQQSAGSSGQPVYPKSADHPGGVSAVDGATTSGPWFVSPIFCFVLRFKIIQNSISERYHSLDAKAKASPLSLEEVCCCF